MWWHRLELVGRGRHKSARGGVGDGRVLFQVHGEGTLECTNNVVSLKKYIRDDTRLS